MDYEPKFGYVSWKNGRERENHAGFKGVVLEEDGKLVYYMIHGQTSNVGRLSIRFHTITLVVKDASTKELLIEVSHKGDFGFISARKKDGGVVPLQEKDEEMMKEFEEKGMFRQRTVNVINKGNLDARFSFRDADSLMRGEYEEWTTNPMCSVGGHHGALRFDFTNSITGIKVASDLTEKVELGSESNDRWFRSNGVERIFRAREYVFAEDLCVFKLADIDGGRSVEGVFYTDATGMKLKRGAGMETVKQFVKPGVELRLDGDYEAVDSWIGMYVKDHEGRMQNYGYGIDPEVN